MARYVEIIEAEARATERERERCAKIAEAAREGVAIEIAGETHPLGIMASRPDAAQACTAVAIARAIRSGT